VRAPTRYLPARLPACWPGKLPVQAASASCQCKLPVRVPFHSHSTKKKFLGGTWAYHTDRTYVALCLEEGAREVGGVCSIAVITQRNRYSRR
jgi:hypothetical protein